MKPLKLLTIFILVISFNSCSKEDNSPAQGNAEFIDSFLDTDIITGLNTLGFNFRSGTETPNISGHFIFNPHVLKNTTYNESYSDDIVYFGGNRYEISNLNSETRKFSLLITDLTGNPNSGVITDTFYYGEGNNFCAFAKIAATTQSESPYLLLAISGTISENGIINAEDAYVNLTDRIDSGFETYRSQGRLLKDEDGLAEKQ